LSVSNFKTRYIPFRKKDIINMIIAKNKSDFLLEESSLYDFCQMVESILHFEFHKELEELKDIYHPINPDLTANEELPEEDIREVNTQLLKTLRKVLNDANYDVISREEIEKAYENSALIGVSVNIDLSAYDFVEIYTRGHRNDVFTVKKLFGLKKIQVEHRILERVLLIARLKSEENTLLKPKTTIIKLFKDVPFEDLEILFPNSKVVMSMKDKLMLAVPAIAAGVPLLLTKVVPALIVAFVIISTYFGVKGTIEEDQMKQAVAVLSALGALGGFIFKQISKYKSKRFLFQKELSDNLYFRNLVNNAGVFYSLIDSAEEEEFKEAVLAYFFLLGSPENLDENQLDKKIEQWFEQEHHCTLDFECSDALEKLKKFKLLQNEKSKTLKVIPLDEALATLDYRWDNYFSYNRELADEIN